MKIILEKNILQSALQKLSKATPTRSTVPILNCVLLSAEKNILTMRTTDLELTIVANIKNAKIDETGSVAISHRTLMEITNAMPETEITLVSDQENKVGIQTDFGNYNIAGIGSDEFPTLPEVDNQKEVRIKTETLRRLIDKTVFALSSDELKPALMGALFEFSSDSVSAVATDGHRLSICSRTDYESKMYMGDVIVPKKFLMLLSQYLEGEEEVSIWVGDNHLTISLEDMTIFSRIIDERYPDYRSVIPQENDKILKVNKEDFLAAVKRVAIFSNRSTKQIALHLSVGGSMITTEDPESASKAKENVKMEYGDEDLVIGYNASYLIDILTHLDTENVILKLKTPISAGLILPENQEENEEITMLLMPMRMSEQ